MRARLFWLVALSLFSLPSLAEAASPDPWLGCWARTYDAAHLAKHPGQSVTAMDVLVAPRNPSSDNDMGFYLAKVSAKFRDKPEVYTNREGSRCAVIGAAGDRLLCFGKTEGEGNFWLEQSGPNLFLRMHDLNQDLTLVPGSDKSAFIRLTPQNPEHASFLLKPASPGACVVR